MVRPAAPPIPPPTTAASTSGTIGRRFLHTLNVASPISAQVNVPKVRNTFCKKCKKHTKQKVSQYKTGKASIFAQGAPLPLPSQKNRHHSQQASQTPRCGGRWRRWWADEALVGLAK